MFIPHPDSKREPEGSKDIASREEAERQVSVADEFIQLVEEYCISEIEKCH